jgi:putative tryptophan/tyrosine transport system substrate-binding protein
VRRRTFIVGLGGAAAWPLVTRAQQVERMRRIGVLMPLDENDPVMKTYVSAFTQTLADLGWTDGRNVRMDLRLTDDISRVRAFAHELVGLQPDIILAVGTPATAGVQQETRTTPIVFVIVVDPVGSGFVASLPRPGGNMTGFMPQEMAMAGKWLELLTQIAPGVKRVAAMFNPDTAPGSGSYYLPSFRGSCQIAQGGVHRGRRSQ